MNGKHLWTSAAILAAIGLFSGAHARAGLVLHWDFNEAGGDALDSSGVGTPANGAFAPCVPATRPAAPATP